MVNDKDEKPAKAKAKEEELPAVPDHYDDEGQRFIWNHEKNAYDPTGEFKDEKK